MWASGRGACGAIEAAGKFGRSYSTAGTFTHRYAHSKAQEQAEQRGLFLDVLSANATRRDAKQFLARFKAPKGSSKPDHRINSVQDEKNKQHRRDQDRLDRMGVNLGGLYAPARAISETPKFTQHAREEPREAVDDTMHVSLVNLRGLDQLDDVTVEGLAVTLGQLVRLDMRIVVILDPDIRRSEDDASDLNAVRVSCQHQQSRLSKALARHNTAGASFVDTALQATPGGAVKMDIPQLLYKRLEKGSIVIVPPYAWNEDMKCVTLPTSQVMVALTRYMARLTSDVNDQPDDIIAANVDRIIVMDPLGGIPSKARQAAHVFINLEHEYGGIEQELSSASSAKPGTSAELGPDQDKSCSANRHIANLDLARQCLAVLPPAASALIITPQEAANSSQQEPDGPIGTGTRKQKNTLIHNLLTNKPVVSSSLPVARLPTSKLGSEDSATVAAPTATLLKRGMPVTIIPHTGVGEGWNVPEDDATSLTLEDDANVDFPSLLHLIEDSFRRKLDVQHYLDRIKGRIAGIIVAGSYEGGAILTWEAPPNAPDDPSRLVPYLDKFAVLQSSQGSSGVADIVFQAMVRSAFPHGVCWRSRKDNPVNKWYFERSAGTWQIPGTNWTMFWTGSGVVEDKQRWEDYVSVCRGVEPSWADGKKPD